MAKATGTASPTNAAAMAIAAALVSALAWGAASYSTGYETWWMPACVGLLVGAAARRGGARGVANGAACAALTAVAIFAGRFLAVRLALPAVIEKQVERLLPRDAYDSMMFEAEQWAKLPPNADIGIFMVAYGYAPGATHPSQVTPVQIYRFQEKEVPLLEELWKTKPTYPQWRTLMKERLTAKTMDETALLPFTLHGHAAADWFFLALGMGVALVAVAMKDPEPVTEPPPA